MQAAMKHQSGEPRPGLISSDTVEVLEELLSHAILLRDLYRKARWQTAGRQIGRLRQLFDVHYREQIQLVDVLLDRLRGLNGADKVFAGDFLRRIRHFPLPPGRASITRLLAEIVDAHESTLNAALPSAAFDGHADRAWTRDFAVGQAVLVNGQQILAMKEQLMHSGRGGRFVLTGADND